MGLHGPQGVWVVPTPAYVHAQGACTHDSACAMGCRCACTSPLTHICVLAPLCVQQEKAQAQSFANALATIGKFMLKKKVGDKDQIYGSVQVRSDARRGCR